jgi:hypothetical protein
MGGTPRIIPGNLSAFSEGKVGWEADHASILLPDRKEIPIRVTMVFHEENGEWKIVQYHASIGVPNPEAFGKNLP